MALAENVDAPSFECGAKDSFFLDDPHRIYLVRAGHLNIFAVELTATGQRSRRILVTRIETGRIALGTSRIALGSSQLSFLAVPGQDTTLAVMDRSSFGSRDSLGIDVVDWIDNWILDLSQFVIRDMPPVSRDAVRLEADPGVPYPPGSVLSAHHLDVLWVSADQPMQFVGHPDWLVPAGRLHPVCERTWFEIETPASVSATHTPFLLANEKIWDAIDCFNVRVLAFVKALRDQATAALTQRYQLGEASKNATADFALAALTDVLEVGSARRPVVRGAQPSSLEFAVGSVAQSLGVATLDRTRTPQDALEPQRAVASIIHGTGLRMRAVTLSPGWWKRNGPSFIGFCAEDGSPLPVVAKERGGYRTLDPQTGIETSVTKANASTIGRRAIVLYAPLASSVRDGLSALKSGAVRCWRDLRTVAAMGVLGALLALAAPVLTGRLLAEFIPRVDTQMWIAALAAICLAAFGNAMFGLVRAFAMLRIEARIDEYVQAGIWSRLLSLRMSFFRGFSSADLADRVNGVTEIRLLLTGATTAAVVSAIFSLASYALLFYYSWSLALVAGALVIVLMGANWFFAVGQISHYRSSFRIQGIIDSLVYQMLVGLPKLRVANATVYALSRWADRFAEQKRESLAARQWHAAQSAFNSMFTPLATLGLFAFIWFGLIVDEERVLFDLASFLSFSAAFGQFSAAMVGLASTVSVIVSVLPLFERVRPILQGEPEESDEGLRVHDFAGQIEFANVSFRYGTSDTNALDSVSFHIRPGDFVAFVGPSGSGKSTIFRLLLGFERPASGTIFLDGHDLSHLDMSVVRSHLGVVMQDGGLLPVSILKNIESTRPLTMDEAWEAAEAAGIADEIRAMPMGMHTVLSESGGLSGGQKQRLLIARALARKPRILLFDEATSALDNRTQAHVQRSLQGRALTRVVVAHRVSTVRDADRIYVMDGGRIVETGKYDELIERGGSFTELARRQVL